MTKVAWEDKGLFLLAILWYSPLWKIRKLKIGTEAESMEERCLLAYDPWCKPWVTACFLIKPRITWPGVTHSGLVHPIPLLVEKMAHWTVWWMLGWVSPNPRSPYFVSSWQKLTSTSGLCISISILYFLDLGQFLSKTVWILALLLTSWHCLNWQYSHVYILKTALFSTFPVSLVFINDVE